MSVSAICSSNSDQLWQAQVTQGKFQKIHSEFETLGQDLQTGNTTQAQSDLATLTQDLQASQPSAAGSINQTLSTLSQALQSGDLSGAQHAYSNVQQDLQQHSSGVGHRHGHHHAGGQQGTAATGSSNDPIDQLISELGQAGQSSDLSTTQQDFATLLQQLAAARSAYVANVDGVAPATTIGTTVNATV